MAFKNILLCLFTLLIIYFQPSLTSAQSKNLKAPYLMVTGVAQDAGYPQMGCDKECCQNVFEQKEKRKMVSSLALVNPQTDQFWLFDATPDMKDQLHLVNHFQKQPESTLPNGIFLTHAHIGHYTGLMQLGREVMGAKKQKVYAMPRLTTFIKNNGPWSQLVELENIDLIELTANNEVTLSQNLSVMPLLVPHRDEFSETVGYVISSKNKKVLFIPDIDKWGKWEMSIVEWIKKVDIAYLDGTFYQDGEIPGRNMADIPHPFIVESMSLMKDMDKRQKQKVRFIHLNHTNPLLRENSPELIQFKQSEFGVAKQGEIIKL